MALCSIHGSYSLEIFIALKISSTLITLISRPSCVRCHTFSLSSHPSPSMPTDLSLRFLLHSGTGMSMKGTLRFMDKVIGWIGLTVAERDASVREDKEDVSLCGGRVKACDVCFNVVADALDMLHSRDFNAACSACRGYDQVSLLNNIKCLERHGRRCGAFFSLRFRCFISHVLTRLSVQSCFLTQLWSQGLRVRGFTPAHLTLYEFPYSAVISMTSQSLFRSSC